MLLDLTKANFLTHNCTTHLSPSHDICTHYLTVFLVWVVSKAHQTSTNVQVIFKWFYLSWTSRQLQGCAHSGQQWLVPTTTQKK